MLNTNHSLHQREDPEASLRPLTFAEQFFKKIIRFSFDSRWGRLARTKAYHPRGILKGTRQSRIDRSHPTAVQTTKRCPFRFNACRGKRTGGCQEGQTNIRPTRCTPLPANSVIFPELLGLNLISFSMIIQGC